MSKTRVVQHRPKREEQKAREVADLKRENNKLKRVVTRLRKAQMKTVLEQEAAVEEGEVELEQAVAATVDACKKCGGPTTVLDLAGRHYRVCKECKDRSRIDDQETD